MTLGLALSLLVTPARAEVPAVAPELVSPARDAQVPANPVLRWRAVPNAVRYRVQVSTSPSFAGGHLYEVETYGLSATPTEDLPLGTVFWRVAGTDGGSGVGPYATGRFERRWSSAPNATAPSDGATLVFPGDAPLFSWDPLPGAETYELEVASNDRFIDATTVSTPATSAALTTTQPVRQDGQISAQRYYWRVRGVSGTSGVNSAWSKARSYRLEWHNRPQRLLPDDEANRAGYPGSIRRVTDVVLEWAPVPGAVEYQVQVSHDENWASGLVIDETVKGTRYSPHVGNRLLNNGGYYWRVRAIDATGGQRNFGNWSSTGQFIREWLQAGAPTAPAPGETVSTPSIRWEAVRNAGLYEVRFRSNGGAWSPPCYTTQAAFTPYTKTAPDGEVGEPVEAAQPCAAAIEAGTVDWRVRGIDPPYSNDDEGAPHGLVSGRVTSSNFVYEPSTAGTAATAPVEMVDPPACSAPSCALPQVTLRWNPVEGAEYYTVQVARDPYFTNNFRTYTTEHTELTPRESWPDSQANQPYFWYVTAHGPGVTSYGPDQDSDNAAERPRPFSKRTVGPQFRHTDDLTEPITAPPSGLKVENQLVMRWHSYLGSGGPVDADHYRVEVSTTPDFSNVIDTRDTVEQTTYTPFDMTYPEGPLHWRVQAVDGSGNALTFGGPFQVEKRSPVPVLVSPRSGAVVDRVPALRWEAQAFADRYELQLARRGDGNFSAQNLISTPTTKQAAYTHREVLGAGEYAWRVRRLDADDRPGPWSPTRTFWVSPAAPGLISPGDAATVGRSNVLFSWSPVPAAVRYQIQTSTTRNFASLLDDERTVMTSYASPRQFAEGQHHWRVRALNADDQVIATSSVRTFEVPPTAVAPPAQARPTGWQTSRRLGGTVNVVNAAVDVSRGSFVDGTAEHVLIGRDDVFADSLAGAALAGKDGPILYTSGGPDGELAPQTQTELRRVLGPATGCNGGKTVFILGGANAVSKQVEDDIKAMGYCVRRFSGGSRVETSVAIAEEVLRRTGSTQVLLARADIWADAATGGAYAAAAGAPIVVTQSSELHQAVAGFLGQHKPKDLVLLGGDAALSPDVHAAAAKLATVRRVSGQARDLTAVAIASQLWPSQQPSGVVLVNGYAETGWAYALAAAVPAAREGAVQIYVQEQIISGGTRAYLDRYDYRFAIAAGPSGLIGEPIYTYVLRGVK
jgi:putative cell wall-binding protein